MLRVELPAVRVRGRVRYTFLDENDQPTFALDQHGRRIWGGHWSPNLITNAGMNNLRTQRVTTYASFGSLAQTYRTTLHLGTGSTEPAFTDSSLVNQVQTSALDGGFTPVSAFPDAVGGVMTATYRVTRIATVASNTNFTEYGFSGEGGQLNIRELFRDEFGDPVTVTIVAGKKIRVDHTLEVSIPWGAEEHEFDILEYDAADALVGTTPMTADGLFVATNAGARDRMFKMALPLVTAGGYENKQGRASLTAGSSDPLVAHPSGDLFDLTWEAYTSGSFTQRGLLTIPEASANGSVRGFSITPSNALSASTVNNGWRLVFKDPTSFTKADTHTLTLVLDWTWARG